MTLTVSRTKSKNEGHYSILCYKSPMKHLTQSTGLTFSLHNLIRPDLDLLNIRPTGTYLHGTFFHPLRSLLAKFGFAAVRSVSVTDKAKSDDFVWPDLDLTCNLFNKLVQFPSIVLVESFPLPPRPARYGHWFPS